MTVIDHIVIAAPDLDAATSWFAELTGVEPSPGGAHPGVGTHNALVSLGDRTYIELIAPDPDQPDPPGERPFGIDGLDGPTLVTYAVAPDDIDDAAERLRTEAGVDLGEVSAMARTRPDGVELSWRLTRSVPAAGDGLIPFLIDWGTTPHPAASSATGCQLASVAFRSPEPASVSAALAVLDLDIPVEEAPAAEIVVHLDTPKGTIALGPG